MVERLPDLVDRDDFLDIIAGSAGCIGSLLALYQWRPAARTLAVAVQCGERLLATAQTMAQGPGLEHRQDTPSADGFFRMEPPAWPGRYYKLATANRDRAFPYRSV